MAHVQIHYPQHRLVGNPAMISPWLTTVASRVAQARSDAGYSKAAFASALGLQRQTYQAYEAAVRPYTLSMLERISSLTNRPLAWLLALDADLAPDEALLLEAYRALGDPQLRALALHSIQLQRDYARLRAESSSGDCS